MVRARAGTVERVHDADFQHPLAVNRRQCDHDELRRRRLGRRRGRPRDRPRRRDRARAHDGARRRDRHPRLRRLEDLTHFGAAFNGTSMFDVQLTQDDLGRVVARTETIGGVTRTLTYVYDAASRLAEIHQNGGTIASYAYDANGNRLNLTTSGGTVNGTYDAQDHLLQYGTTSFDYDAAGQLTTKTVGGQTTTYAYDETGNLLE